MRKKSKKTRDLIGRDPSFGKVSFRTGRIQTLRDKLRNRKSKALKEHLRNLNEN